MQVQLAECESCLHGASSVGRVGVLLVACESEKNSEYMLLVVPKMHVSKPGCRYLEVNGKWCVHVIGMLST